jgi:hypothetical protein
VFRGGKHLGFGLLYLHLFARSFFTEVCHEGKYGRMAALLGLAQEGAKVPFIIAGLYLMSFFSIKWDRVVTVSDGAVGRG